MKFSVYTDISVSVFTEIDADNATEAIRLAEKKSQSMLSSALNKKGFSVDETLGYCMANDDSLDLNGNEYYQKYGVSPAMRY